MKEIINYLRQCLCKHDWDIKEKYMRTEKLTYDRNSERIYMRCKKCGYHPKHWEKIIWKLK